MVQLLIFYGGLLIFLGAGLIYALKVSRRGKPKDISVPVITKSPNALNHELHAEFVDRAHVASSYVQMALGGHPALTRHPDLMPLYREAVDKLEDLYQAAGRMDKP